MKFAIPTFALALLLVTGSADATTVRYQLEHDSNENGFGFSGLHWATGCNYMCGAAIADLDGSLFFDRVGTDYDIVRHSVLTASNGWSLEIVGGSISGLDGSGQLDYILSGLQPAPLSGSFRFGAGHMAGAANSMDDVQLRLWGHSMPGTIDDSITPIGMDLGARAVPEPSAALVFGIGSLIAATRTRRRT